MRYCWRERHIEQNKEARNRLAQTCPNVFFYKGAKTIQQEKIGFSTNGGEIGHS